MRIHSDPLPIRIEPLPDETWPSYATRVAHHYEVSIHDLYRPLPLLEPSSLALGRGERTSQRMMSLLAARFRLTPSEVNDMFLSRFAAVPDCEALTPDLRGQVTGPKQRPRWVRRGPVPFCPECRRQYPGTTRVSWHLRLGIICVHHRRYISHSPMRRRPTPAQVMWQQHVLETAMAPTATGHAWLERQYRMLSPLLGSHSNIPLTPDVLIRAATLTGWTGDYEPIHTTWLAREPAQRERYERLICQFRDVATAQDLVLLPDPAATTLMLAYAGQATIDRDEVQPWFGLLPRRYFEGAISDLVWEFPEHVGRRTAGMVAHAWLFNYSIRDVSVTQRMRRLADATRLLHTLQQHGRLDDFLSLCAQAGQAIGRQPNAPLHPRGARLTAHLLSQLRADIPTRVSIETLRDWAMSHWLNFNIPPTEERACAANDLDRRWGTRLRAALATDAFEFCHAS